MDSDRRILENTQWHTFQFQTDNEHTQTTQPSLKEEPIPTPILEEETQQQEQNNNNIPTNIITTTTTTATFQQYRLNITKTFEDTSSQTNKDDDSIYETRTSVLLEQMASLHGQLNNILPTRSYYSSTPATNTLTPTDIGSHPSVISSSCSSSLSSPYSAPLTNDSWDDNIKSIDGLSTTSSNSSLNHHHNGEVIFLHPLQAAQEDMNLYETNLNTFKQQAESIIEGMKWVREKHLEIMNNTNLITNSDEQNDQNNQMNNKNEDDNENHDNENNKNDIQVINDSDNDDDSNKDNVNNNIEDINIDNNDDIDNIKVNGLQSENDENSPIDNLMTVTTTNNNNNQQLTFYQQKKVARISQMEQAYVSLMHRMEQAEKQYLAFHQGFDFSQACHGVRAALHSIQSKMMQKTTTDHDVQALEDNVASTANQLVLIRNQYNDLLLNENDPKYEQRWKSIQLKNDIVTSWVEEVKVWFAEAERIRTWIDQRRDQLEETNLPNPMAPLLHEDKLNNNNDDEMNIRFITKEDLEKSHEWRERHQSLEEEMETFDKQDMARLRAHVKALTGGKDLSPADTTTIEITLTTLTTLDKVMHTLRDKSHKLHLLTQRSLWEKEFETTMDWLHTTENEVDTFLGQARWTLNNQHTMNKATFIDGLVQLEHKLSDFDKNQFTNTIDSFQDFDDTAQIDLPYYLENRQTNCEQFFEDLFKRLAFVRSVVEQRLELIDFMDISQHVFDDANQLLINLKQNCSFSTNDDDKEDDNDEMLWADRVQNIQEQIISLASTQRISYPMATLTIDQEDNEFANQVIRQHVTQQRTSLVLLGESVDEQWQSLRHRWQLRHNVKEVLLGTDKWKAWADERLRQINENHQHLLEQQEKILSKNQPKNKNFLNMIASALDQINHWERAVSNIKLKLVTKESNIDEFMNKSEQLKNNIYQLNENIDDNNCKYIIDLNNSLNGMSTSYQDLRHLLNTHQQALEQFRHDLEQGSNIIDMRNELWNFVHALRTSLPNIKQKCGFMTGHSQSQDKERFDTLTQNYEEWKDQLQNKQKLFNQWQYDIQNESSQEDELLKNNNLIAEWDILVDELNDLGNFKDEVFKWYDRQRKLSLVEHELSLFDEKSSNMNNSNDDDDDDDDDDDTMIQVGLKQQNILKEIGETIQLGTSKEGSIMDPLQTANYSCAHERYQSLISKAQQLVKEGEERKKQKQNTIELQQYKDQVNEFLNTLQFNRDMILERVTQHQSQAWAQTMEHNSNALAVLIRTIQQGTQTMDAQVQHQYHVQREDLRKKKNRILLTQLSTNKEKNNNKDDVIADDDKDDQQMNIAMDELEKAMALEKKQISIFKHLHAYAKAAMDLDQWLVQGNSALLQLTSDIGVIDEVEILATLTRFETKLDNIQPTLQGFQRMHDKIIMMADENHMLDDAFKSQMNSSFLKLQQGFDDMKYQLNDIQQSMYRHKHHASIARKMKDILQMIGNYRDRSNNIKLYSDQQNQQQQKIEEKEVDEKEDDKDKENVIDCLSLALKTCNLSSIPTDRDIELTRDELDKLEQDIQLHLDIALQDLDEALKNEQKENGDDIFTDQRKEITQAITELQQSIKDKKYWLSEAEKLENVLTVLDEWEVLLSALTEVVHRATVSETPQLSRADLQAMLIDLDTRYKYYEPNILSLVKEAQLIMMDVEDPRLIKFYNQLTEQWQQLRRLALEKKNDIISRINPLADPLMLSQLYDVIPNGRQQQRRNIPLTSSVSTLTTSTTVHSNHNDKTLLRKSSFPTKTMTTTRVRPRTVTPNSLNGTAPRLMTAERALKRSSWHQQKRQSSAPSFGSINNKNTYVADPKNDLDVAVGNIVNDSPYAIPVKMVPGEVGRYWFGKKNPKLVYCRILRSRIVMVRVGGGWVELSQFLRDHALLEDGRFTSTKGQRLSESTNNNKNDNKNDNSDNMTTTVTADKKKKRHSQPLENSKDMNQPELRHSRSTPFQASTYYCYSARGHSPIPTTHGVKEGNKFVVTDDDGKKVQVTMTKEKNKQTSKFKIPWR